MALSRLAAPFQRSSASKGGYRLVIQAAGCQIHSVRLNLRLFSQEATMHKTSTIEENYGRFEDDDRSWDVAFWQRRGGAEIFAAA